MKTAYPNVWGDGALFAGSGYDSATDYTHPFVGRLLKDDIGIEVYSLKERGKGGLVPSFLFSIAGKGISNSNYDEGASIVAGDHVSLLWDNGRTAAITILEHGVYALTVQGIAGARLQWHLSNPLIRCALCTEEAVFTTDQGTIEAPGTRRKTTWIIRLAYGDASSMENRNVHGDAARRLPARIGSTLDFFDRLPVPDGISDDRQSTYAKAASVLKLNVESAQGKMSVPWTTPDKWPHRQMWIWDSAFHALGWNYIDRDMAYNAIAAVVERVHEDGFLPLCMDPHTDRVGHETQPPVLGWALDKLLDAGTMDVAKVDFVYPRLSRFIKWLLEHRSQTDSGLLGWHKKEHDPRCRCGESGWDNSNRFDHDGPDDNIDLVSFVVNELSVLEVMAQRLAKVKHAAIWQSQRERLTALANKKMWCEEDGLYYDLDQSGNFVRLKTAACFYPLTAGIPDQRRAARLVSNLRNEKLFWTRMPVPTLSPSESAFEKDMWRGPTWINNDYLIACGLERYGFRAEARALAESVAGEVERWYRTTGCLMEYYDCEGQEDPRFMARKGSRTEGIRVIRDYGWSAGLYLAFVNEFLTD